MKSNFQFKIKAGFLLLSFFTFQGSVHAAVLETASLLKPVKTMDSQSPAPTAAAPVVSSGQDSSSFLQQKAISSPLALAAVVPTAPVITSSVPPSTNKDTLVISGTKQINTSILINGAEVVANNNSTVWSASLTLIGQGFNSFSITAKDMLGQQSSPLPLQVLRDTIPPILSPGINHHFPFDDGL